MAETREAILSRFREKVAAGKPIIGGGAGTGISAKCEEAGGIDLIVIYNSGRYRMAGRGSLAGLMPYGNANKIVREMAREVLTAVRHTPVLAGVCATDPFMLRDQFLRELRDMGFAGIQNFPTVGLIDGMFRANLEETGMGFGLEVDCIAAAHGLRIYFRLPKRLHGQFGDRVRYLASGSAHRYLSVHANRFALWHTLHQHDPYRPPLGSRRRVATIHDLNQLYGSDRGFMLKSNRRLARIVATHDSFVAISEHTRRDLQRVHGDTLPVTVIPNGVRDFSQQPQERPEGAPEPGFLLHLSRMSALKNVDSLLAMMQRLPGRLLVLAGPRSGESESVEVKARAMGLANVRFLFDVSTACKAWLYAHCGAFLFPSIAEGFGLPPVEAMQFGKPVFLSTLTSLPEVGGDAAFYWPDFAPEAMAGVLERSLAGWRDEADAARMRAQAARFTWERCIDGYLSHYRSLLGLTA